MTGRGIDQILHDPVDPVLYEPHICDARDYVRLAEARHGPIPSPADDGYIWGDALGELERAGTDLRIANLETSITRHDRPWPDKAIHYRMSPANLGCITRAGIDCCCIANNHVLDWGYPGLEETISSLDQTGSLSHTGAGRDLTAAEAPAVLSLADRGRVLVFALGSTSSGVPPEWSAGKTRPGISLLNDLSIDTARAVGARVRRFRQSGDIAIVSIHWGANWGYAIPDEHIAFAHGLIDEGVDLVHGHSSHHVKAIEVYRQRLILYGCGDFIDDYEGIRGYEEFRSDLRLMYLVHVAAGKGQVLHVELVPFGIRGFRLARASGEETQWLLNLLNEQGRPFRTGVELRHDDTLGLSW